MAGHRCEVRTLRALADSAMMRSQRTKAWSRKRTL